MNKGKEEEEAKIMKKETLKERVTDFWNSLSLSLSLSHTQAVPLFYFVLTCIYTSRHTCILTYRWIHFVKLSKKKEIILISYRNWLRKISVDLYTQL